MNYPEGRNGFAPTDEVAVSADGRTGRGEATDLCPLLFAPCSLLFAQGVEGKAKLKSGTFSG